ncbi:hypothetical protein ACTXT7_001428 [Hymenolepis weldensis]
MDSYFPTTGCINVPNICPYGADRAPNSDRVCKIPPHKNTLTCFELQKLTRTFSGTFTLPTPSNPKPHTLVKPICSHSTLSAYSAAATSTICLAVFLT